MNYTSAIVNDTLYRIARNFHDDYAAQAAEATGRAEKKALTIQAEMAELCIRCGLMAHTGGTQVRIMATRMLNPQGFLALIDATCYKAFCCLNPTDRDIITPYLHGLYFMANSVLFKWHRELEQYRQFSENRFAETAITDIEAGMETELKYRTVLLVLKAWQNWWKENAANLPTLPPMPVMEELLHE